MEYHINANKTVDLISESEFNLRIFFTLIKRKPRLNYFSESNYRKGQTSLGVAYKMLLKQALIGIIK